MTIDRQQLLNEIGIFKNENEISFSGWVDISQDKILSEEFIRIFRNHICWNNVCRFQKLSETFLEEFKAEAYWVTLSRYQSLSEDFIRKHQNDVYWANISFYQVLSENFIREFEDKVFWIGISSYQNLSLAFLIEFKNQITWKNYFHHNRTNFHIVKKIISKTDYVNINELPHSMLNVEQKKELYKIIALKYMFINKPIN